MGHSTRRGEKTPIWFGSYSIKNGLNVGLQSEIRGVSQDNLDLGVLQETKITDGIFTRGLEGYNVGATYVPSQHHGKVAVFYRASPQLEIEVIQKFGPNVVSFKLKKR